MYLAFCYQESPSPHVSSYSCLSLPLQPIPLHLRGSTFLLPCQRHLRRMNLPRTSFYLPRQPCSLLQHEPHLLWHAPAGQSPMHYASRHPVNCVPLSSRRSEEHTSELQSQS